MRWGSMHPIRGSSGGAGFEEISGS